VLVYVGGGGESVYVKKQGDAEVIGENASSFTISATFDSKSLETTEVKPVDPVWSCTYQGATFVPPSGVEPVPEEPSKPNVSALTPISSYSDDNSSWTTKVSSPNAGQWILKFKVTVKYSKQSKTTGQNIPNEFFGPFEGENTFSFIAINKTWKVKLTPENDVVCRHSTKPPNRPVIKVTASLENADSDKTVKISSSTTGGIVKFGTENNNATNENITLTIPKAGSKDFYISGEKESTKTNDVIIAATTNDTPPAIVGSANATVLWVNIKINTTGEISKDNSRRAEVLRMRGHTKLGKNVFTLRVIDDDDDDDKFRVFFCFRLESEGSALPQDFTNELKFRRDAAVVKKNKATGNYVIEHKFDQKLGIITPKVIDDKGKVSYKDDTGPDKLRDDIPPKIYDYDEPGTGTIYEKTEVDDIRERDVEFKQYFRILVAYNDKERCSDIIAYEIKHKIYYEINTNLAAERFVIYKHETDFNINPNNTNSENDYYNFSELTPP
jgi:hypothetical protein